MMQFCDHIGLDMPEDQVMEVMEAININHEQILNKFDFLKFVDTYTKAMLALNPDLDMFEMYPEGGKAWVYDAKLRANGKLWKNILLTQYLLVPPTTALCCAVYACDPMTLGVTDPDFPHPILRIDSDVECRTPRYDGVEALGFVGILIYAVVTPLFWIALLYKNRNRLNSFRISQQLGFFCEFMPLASCL